MRPPAEIAAISDTTFGAIGWADKNQKTDEVDATRWGE
jgi:hypothetical protein